MARITQIQHIHIAFFGGAEELLRKDVVHGAWPDYQALGTKNPNGRFMPVMSFLPNHINTSVYVVKVQTLLLNPQKELE